MKTNTTNQNTFDSRLDQIQHGLLPQERRSISGFVTLRRKDNWVRRYATVNGVAQTFSYRNQQSDKADKYSFSLIGAKIKRGVLQSKPYIVIEGDGLVKNKDKKAVGGNQSLRISFESDDEF